jgi:Surface lipoprotein
LFSIKGREKIFFKPLEKGYDFFQKPIRFGTSNVLSNLFNVVTIPNNLLQGQIKDAGVNSARFVLNTTLGIVGIF